MLALEDTNAEGTANSAADSADSEELEEEDVEF